MVVITHCIFLLNFHIRTNNTSFQYMLVVFASVHQITVKSCTVRPVFLLKQVTIIRYLNLLCIHNFRLSDSSVCVCCDVFCCLEYPVFVLGLSFVDLECCEMVHFANIVSSIFFVRVLCCKKNLMNWSLLIHWLKFFLHQVSQI